MSVSSSKINLVEKIQGIGETEFDLVLLIFLIMMILL